MGKQIPQLLVSDAKGRVNNVSDLMAAGMKGGHFFSLPEGEFIKMPPGSRLFMLPHRQPVGYDPCTKKYVILENCFAVAAFMSPGFTATFNSAYQENNRAKILPLFSYACAAFYKGEFYVTAIKVDKDVRHDPRFIDINLVKKNIPKTKKLFPKNRLVDHLRNCALIYGCPNAQNFFLSRYEAPLPVSPACNASCAGCISYQSRNRCPASQPRIKFIPCPEEIAQIALFHISRVKDPVVSFGQGCEGEPLLAGGVIEKAVRLIRKETSKGVININTNASKPKVLSKLFDAGLDSVRVSLNSVREEYYTRYYKPVGYGLKDVLRSIKIAESKGGFISINYLSMPGFTDSKDEFAAFRKFIEVYRVDMIQWRNLNFDSLEYFRELKISIDRTRMLGIRQVMSYLKKTIPRVRMGYFNPGRGAVRHRKIKGGLSCKI